MGFNMITPSTPKIAIIGTMGVPARYGGFETLAEQLATRITLDIAELTIYCQSSAYSGHECAEPFFAGHRRVFLPLRANGPGSMLYDAFSILHAIYKAKVNVLLILGYSGAWILPVIRVLAPNLRIVTNIDGMEWRRNKFSSTAKLALRILEWCAVRFSHQLIADNRGIVEIARDIYSIEPLLITYGGDHTLSSHDSKPPTHDGHHYLSIARIEPENNCHIILAAFKATRTPLVFIGNWHASEYGRTLKRQYSGIETIRLLDSIYNQTDLLAIRSTSTAYIHGHSVGGTNPSLVEALFHTDRVLAFDCSFNRFTLMNHGAYFDSTGSLIQLLHQKGSGRIEEKGLLTLRDRYLWDKIVKAYLHTLINTPSPC